VDELALYCYATGEVAETTPPLWREGHDVTVRTRTKKIKRDTYKGPPIVALDRRRKPIGIQERIDAFHSDSPCQTRINQPFDMSNPDARAAKHQVFGQHGHGSRFAVDPLTGKKISADKAKGHAARKHKEKGKGGSSVENKITPEARKKAARKSGKEKGGHALYGMREAPKEGRYRSDKHVDGVKATSARKERAHAAKPHQNSSALVKAKGHLERSAKKQRSTRSRTEPTSRSVKAESVRNAASPTDASRRRVKNRGSTGKKGPGEVVTAGGRRLKGVAQQRGMFGGGDYDNFRQSPSPPQQTPYRGGESPDGQYAPAPYGYSNSPIPSQEGYGQRY